MNAYILYFPSLYLIDARLMKQRTRIPCDLPRQSSLAEKLKSSMRSSMAKKEGEYPCYPSPLRVCSMAIWSKVRSIAGTSS